jgi:beta-N-acetylhexosaminidase
MKLTSLRKQVGQLLIMGFEATSFGPNLEHLLKEWQPSGVILFTRNIESAQQTHALLSACRKAISTTPFLCVDMEGGSVDRLKEIMTPAPSAASVFASGKKSWFTRHGKLIGAECHALGFNTNFAPALDLAFESSRPVLGSRVVSSDPRQTAGFARSFLRGLRSAGVLGCGKHFPGLGEATLDTHNELAVIQKPWKALWKQDLLPYRLLRRELPFVMVGHANYAAVTGDKLPASISYKWTTEILRNKIGYRGLVLSDDMEMGAVLAAGSIELAAVESIRAGVDMVLVCHQEQMVRRAAQALLTEAERDPAFARRVAESASRVLAFKKRAKELKKFPSRFSVALVEKARNEMAEFSTQLTLASAQKSFTI